ncbi:MAG: amidophosphoribosyltransferase [Methanomicrobiales archaeon HGW-Methanomicrobiales-3]|jgi:amidophosphoribosyltransferase|nr:MAG: amidophosphoribosyltransferase [Methanomicrobiales archaeon HGW-Methanomicrobiales-3]
MCGIVGIVDAGGVSIQLYYALYALQHRGQESAGISTFDGTSLHKFKGSGLVADVFSPSVLSDLQGNAGIGHVRYPTTGFNLPENIQPLNFQFQDHFISIAHNGNLVNTAALRADYEKEGQIFTTTTDTEVIAKILMDEIGRSGIVEDAVHVCMQKIEGSYSVVMLIDGAIYAFRDPLGIKPFVIGKTENGYMVASESVAIDALGGKLVRDVKPGELIRVDGNGINCTQVAVAGQRAHCIFEYIYFARADSVIDGVLVYDVRRRIGGKLHDEAPVNADSVGALPDSGTAYAIGYAEQSKIPYVECLMKNRYMGRTFIMPTQKEREKAVRMKLNPIPAHLEGKSVVLVDDSIVRGTTSKRILGIVREAGAREIHVRVGSPAIKAPCYLGTDFPTREELIAHNRNQEEVRKSITATTLHHISFDAMIEASGFSRHDLCTGCLTGCYPVPIDGEQAKPVRIDFVDSTVQAKLESFEA